MKLLIKNIGVLAGVRLEDELLRGKALAEMPMITDAYLLLEDGIIAAYGSMSDLETDIPQKPSHEVDAHGGFILPAWCDSHTHLVFAGSREAEFVDKIKGMSYADIAAKGGGILNSARRLNDATEDQLFLDAWKRLQDLMKLGTGAIEIKSGYGLTEEGELKMLRVIKRLKEKSPIPVKASFLGAHTYPMEYKENHEGYISLLIENLLPKISDEGLADYIDVFCEQGFFSVEEMERIVKAGASHGLKPKLHINQLNSLGGIQSAVNMNAISVDHLEVMTEDDIQCLSASNTIGTLLPTAAYFLRMPFQPARTLIDAGACIALASDFNPGSSPSGNMNQVVSMSCIQMRMLPEEAIQAATIQGAYAMELQNEVGSIRIGKRANLILTQPIPSLAYLPYAFGSNLIKNVFINGEPLF
jgi:imidazolonepropionase